jgi:hypothetical protein
VFKRYFLALWLGRVDAAHEQRVAVGCRPGHIAGADGRAGTRLVLHHERLNGSSLSEAGGGSRPAPAEDDYEAPGEIKSRAVA